MLPTNGIFAWQALANQSSLVLNIREVHDLHFACAGVTIFLMRDTVRYCLAYVI